MPRPAETHRTGHLRVASVAGSADGHPTGRTPAPPRRHRPWRQPRRPLVLAARAGGSRRAGLPRGGERLHRGHARTPGRTPRGTLRGDEGPDQGDRHVGAGPAGTLVVLHPHRGGRELRHPLPAARPRHGRAAAGRGAGRGGADPPRRERAGRRLGLLRRGQRRRQPRPPLAGLLDRPRRGREVRAALHAARRRHRAGLRGRARHRVTDWPGPPAPTTSSTSAWTRRCAPSSCGVTGWASDPVSDVLVVEEPDRRFALGVGHHPRRGLRARRPAQHEHHRVVGHPGRPSPGVTARAHGAPGGCRVRRRPSRAGVPVGAGSSR